VLCRNHASGRTSRRLLASAVEQKRISSGIRRFGSRRPNLSEQQQS
jgi:hypothetical protein